MSCLSPALAAQLQEVIDRWSANQAQFADWLAGTVGGGPNNDGRYPLTNAQGVEVSVAAPATIMDMVEGPAAQAQVAKLAAQSAASAAATSSSNTDAAKVLAEAAKTAAVAARNLAQTAQSNASNHEANARYWAELAVGKGGEITVMVQTVTDLAQQVAADAVATEANAESAAVSAGLAATFEPNNFDLKSDPINANRITGTISLANLPVMPGPAHHASTGGFADLTSSQQTAIKSGDFVTISDGRRWVYKGSGSKTAEASYIKIADDTPSWDMIDGKPTTFLPSAHSHNYTDINGFTWANLGAKPLTFAPSAHGHDWSEISGKPSTFAATPHTHTFADITDRASGTVIGAISLAAANTPASLVLKGGTSNHSYMEFYADASDQGTRSGYLGYGAAGGTSFYLANQRSGGDILLSTAGGVGVLRFNNQSVWHAGNDGSGSGLDADVLDGMQPSEAASGSTIVSRNANARTSIKGIDYAVSLGDLVNDAPWYGSGRSNLTFHGAGTDVMQHAGYYGVRVRSASTTLDVHQNRVVIGVPGGKDVRIDGHLTATQGMIDYSRDDNGSRPARVLIPEGGVYVSQSSTVTGAMKIRLPAAMNNSNTMLTFTVVVFEYSTGLTKRFHLAGYNYNNTWINVSARQDGDAQSSAYNIRYGHDGVSNCIWIGETGSQWSYPQVHIMDVTLGYSGYSNAMATGWLVGFVTGFDTVTASRYAALSWTSNNDGSGSGLDADLIDGIQGSQLMRTDASSAFNPSNTSILTHFNMSSGQSAASSSGSLAPLEIRQQNGSTGDAFISFHLSARYATYFGIDGTTNQPFWGGWSAGATKFRMWHAGNDGAGSGLDADLLDGLESTAFFRSTGGTVSGDITATGNITGPDYFASGWFRPTGAGGLFWQNYGRGIQIADANSSYGHIQTYGSGVNGWSGYNLSNDNKSCLMGNGSTWGVYNPQWGWMMSSDYTGNVTFGGNVTAYSDLRLKDNVRPIDNVTDRRDNLAKAAIQYEREGRTRIGYGAQIVREVNPEFVHEADDARKLASDLGTLSVDYGETAAILAVASKNTDDELAALKAQVAALTAVVAAMQRNQ